MKVLNKNKISVKECLDGVNIMRGSRWGNPFIIGVDGDREEVVCLFEQYAMWRLCIQPEWLSPLEGKDVMCCCAPKKCHGDVIVNILENLEGLP